MSGTTMESVNKLGSVSLAGSLLSAVAVSALIVSHVTAQSPNESPPPSSTEGTEFVCDTGPYSGPGCGCLDVALLIDVTGSVGPTDQIAQELSCVLDVAALRTNGDVRAGLITFTNSVSVIHTFTDIATVQTALANLMGDYGNKEPEASDEALREMLSDTICSSSGDFNTPFRVDCQKVAVLVTDAHPGGCDDIYDDQVDKPNAHLRAQEAAAAGVAIAAFELGQHPLTDIPVIMADYASTTGG